MRIYSEHIERVKRVVPKEQLLVMSVKEGWEPLCRFLDKDIPKGDFPRSNSTADKQKDLIKMKRVRNVITVATCLTSLLAIGCAYVGYKTYNNKQEL